MAKNTEVILRAEVEDLGHPGDVIEVAPGYARNYLFPRGLAYPANEANKHRVEQEKKRYLERLGQEKVDAERLAAELADVTIEFQELAGEEEQLYGSVSAADVAQALADRGFEIERSRVKLDPPIKQLGEHQVTVRLHPEVAVEIRVVVNRAEA